MATTARFGTLSTDRLLMRRWQDSDRAPLAELNADPEMMPFYPKTLDRAASDALAGELEDTFATHGAGMRALEITQTGQSTGSPLPCVTCQLIGDDRGSRNEG